MPLFLQQKQKRIDMLFYMGKRVDYNNPQNALEKETAEQIQEIKNKYFSDTTMGYVTIVYPKGKPDFGTAEWRNVWGTLKKYAVSNKGYDNAWRWSSSMPPYDNKGRIDFQEPAQFVMYKTVIEKDKADWLWFLLHQSSDIFSKKIYIEDLEAEAKEENEIISIDAEISALLFGKRSPVAKNAQLLLNVAEVMGISEVKKKGIERVKNELYNLVVEGEERGDRFVNADKLFELTDGESIAKRAHKARACMSDGIVKFKNGKWFLMEESSYAEELVHIKNEDMPYKEKVFIDEIVNNDNIRSRLFDSLGIEDFVTADDLRKLNLQVLKKKAQLEIGMDAIKQNDRKEEVIKRLCDHRKVEYTEP